MPTMKVYNGTEWVTWGGVTPNTSKTFVNTTEPLEAEVGDLWYDPSGETLTALTDTHPTFTNLVSRVDDLYTQRYDIREYGDPFTGDAGAVFTAAITDMNTKGGGILTGPVGEYAFTSGIVVNDGVELDFPQEAHFNFSAVTSPITVDGATTCISLNGSVTALPAFTGTVAKGSRTITFASDVSAILKKGDVILVYNSADSSFSTSRTYYRAGEYLSVSDVAGTTVTVASDIYDTYVSGGTTTMYRMNAARTRLQGFSATFKAGVTGIRIKYGRGVEINGLNLTGSNTHHVWFDRCYQSSASNNIIVDHSPVGSTNYGILIGNSQRITCADNFLETARHGLAMGGASLVGGVPNREIDVHGGTIASSQGSYGADCHGNAEYIAFRDVFLPSGIDFSGDFITVEGCTIRGGQGGVAIYHNSGLGINHTIRDNTIIATKPFDQLVYIRIAADTTRKSSLLIEDNRIELNGVDPVSPGNNGIYIINEGSTPLHDITVKNNTITDTRTTLLNTSYAAYIHSNSGYGWGKLLFDGNNLRNRGIRVSLSAESVYVIGNRIDGSCTTGVTFTVPTGAVQNTLWVNVERNFITETHGAGISLWGVRTVTRARVANNTVLNAQRTPATGSTNAAIYLRALNHLDFFENVTGDEKATTTQTYAYTQYDIASVYERDTRIVGTITAVFTGLLDARLVRSYDLGSSAIRTKTTGVFKLVPQAAPASGEVGDMYMTTAGVLMVCTVAGTPGTWVAVGTQT